MKIQNSKKEIREFEQNLVLLQSFHQKLIQKQNMLAEYRRRIKLIQEKLQSFISNLNEEDSKGDTLVSSEGKIKEELFKNYQTLFDLLKTQGPNINLSPNFEREIFEKMKIVNYLIILYYPLILYFIFI